MKKILLITVCLFSLTFVIRNFQNVQQALPIAYLDEEDWVGGSYFFQFYIHGNFDKEVWDNISAKDQPMLTKFLFGAWLYPKYLEAKNKNPDLDYTKYLINNGYYYVDRYNGYEEYAHLLSDDSKTLKYGDAGLPGELLEKYGPNIQGNINLINQARQLNLILLTLIVILVFLFMKSIKRFYFALAVTILYAYNSLILHSGLRAHSETLFLLLFNCSVFFLYEYILQKNSIKNLILFSIFAGLCFSTKINGIMLYPIYLVQILITFKLPSLNEIPFKMVKLLSPLLIMLVMFTILNPYTYPSPLPNIYNMFTHRQETVLLQSKLFPDASLPTINKRIEFVTESLSNNYQFLKENPFGKYIGRLILTILFITGLLFEVGLIIKKNKLSKFILATFICTLVITIAYLQLAWPRYLAHLVIFVIYYQVIGMFFYLKRFLKLSL